MGRLPLTLLALATGIALLAPSPAAAKSGWERCGSSRGEFPIHGAPNLTGEVRVTARRVRCGKARRIGHRIFFRQECVYCDDPSNYGYGDRFRFKGLRCVVHRGKPQRFHCARGSRVVNVRTSIDQV